MPHKSQTHTPYLKARQALKQKLSHLKKNIPTNWIVLFIHDHPHYSGKENFLSSVMAGRSLHESTILEIEAWHQGLLSKTSKKTYVKS